MFILVKKKNHSFLVFNCPLISFPTSVHSLRVLPWIVAYFFSTLFPHTFFATSPSYVLRVFFFNLSFLLLLILLLRVRVLVSPPLPPPLFSLYFLHCICPQVFHSCPLSPSSSLRPSRALLHLLSEHKHRLLRKFLLVQI